MSWMDEATDFLTAFTVLRNFSGTLFAASMVSAGVNALARLCLAAHRLVFPPKGVSVNMALPFVWLRMLFSALAMTIEPITGTWLVGTLIHPSSSSAAFVEGGAGQSAASQGVQQAANKLMVFIIETKARAQTDLMIGVLEDVPALAIDVAFVAQGGLAESTASDLGLFFVSAVISVLHSAKCIWSWRRLNGMTDRAVGRSPVLKKMAVDAGLRIKGTGNDLTPVFRVDSCEFAATNGLYRKNGTHRTMQQYCRVDDTRQRIYWSGGSHSRTGWSADADWGDYQSGRDSVFNRTKSATPPEKGWLKYSDESPSAMRIVYV